MNEIDEPMVCLDMLPRLPSGARKRMGVWDQKLWGDARRRAHPNPGQKPTLLRVAFLDGPPALQRKVENAAREWMKHAHVELAFVDTPEGTDIRISFEADPSGCWSLIGTDCQSRGD